MELLVPYPPTTKLFVVSKLSPLFDVVLVSISLNLITIIFIVIKKIRKSKKKIHPIKMGLR